mmetsp:Transcript_9473/g.18281  ORF Transcript_9473/g.18281 Transcript_9473/m.18281 type:complete len:245 (-) Transcript_9473:5-739(-)
MEALASFQLDRVAKTDIGGHQLTLAGKFKQEEVLLNLTARCPDTTILGEIVELTQIHANDVYYKYEAKLAQITIDCEVKHTQEESAGLVYVNETPELYNTISKSWIEALDPPHTLEGSLVEPEFTIFKKNVSGEASFVVVVNDLSLRSIRDLDGRHLELLSKIKTEAAAYIAEQLHVHPLNFLMFTQYPPDTSRLTFSVARSNYSLGCYRNVLLSDLISNLTLYPSYYQTAVLSIAVPLTHPLA